MVAFGAVIAGKKEIINYFKYNLRSQIFSKSMPMPIVYGLNERLKIVKNADENRQKLFEITDFLHEGLIERNLLNENINSCITPIYFDIETNEVFNLQQELVQNYGIFCSVIIYPVVPKGKVIFRITPTSLHTKDDVLQTLESFDTVFTKYI
jgi:glycine C-acetyltransferase